MNLSIIGGGISGLCTGIYALKKGFKCTIYEKNKYLGGILNENINDTYLIYENEDFYKSLGLIDLHLETKPYLTSYKGLYINNDLNEFINNLKSKSINDIKNIEKLEEDLIKASKYKFNYDYALDLLGFIEKTKKLLANNQSAALIKKYSKISVNDYFKSFYDEDIKTLFLNIIPNNYPVYILFIYLSLYFNSKLLVLKDKNELIKSLSNYYLSLGGIINTNTEIKKINLHHMKVESIYTNDDKNIKTDIVVYCADPYFLFTRLLDNKFNDRKFMLRYEDYKAYPLTSTMQIKYNLKANEKLEEEFILKLDAFKIASSIINYLKIKVKDNYLYVNLFINNDDYRYFKILSKDKRTYEKELDNIQSICSKAIVSGIKNTYGIDIKLSLADLYSPLEFEDKYKRYQANISGFGISLGGEMYISDGRLSAIKSLYISNGFLNSPSNILDIMINCKNVLERIERDEKIPI